MNIINLTENNFIIKEGKLMLLTNVKNHNIFIQVENMDANISGVIELLTKYFKADNNDMIVDEASLGDAGVILPTSLKCLTCSNEDNIALNGSLEGIASYRKYFADSRMKYVIMTYNNGIKHTKSCTEELANQLNIKIIHIINK